MAETPVGRVGNLICGENTNPLARYALMAQGEQIDISSWPPIWPTRRPSGGGNFNNVAANRIRASAHSFEKAFGIVTAGFLNAAMRELLIARDKSVAEVTSGTQRAASFFVDPTGEIFGDMPSGSRKVSPMRSATFAAASSRSSSTMSSAITIASMSSTSRSTASA